MGKSIAGGRLVYLRVAIHSACAAASKCRITRLHERLLLLAIIIVCRVALSVRETSKQLQHEMMLGTCAYSTCLNKESHKEFIGYMGQRGVDFSMHAAPCRLSAGVYSGKGEQEPRMALM